jgi:hypothetical protein
MAARGHAPPRVKVTNRVLYPVAAAHEWIEQQIKA